jgi:AcrR family transcriptional regulator
MGGLPMSVIKNRTGRPRTLDRDHLLNIAESHFAKQGFEGTSTRKLCKAAGCNLAMISYYFGGKEGLYQEVIKRHIKKVLHSPKETAEPSRDFAHKFSKPEENEMFEILTRVAESAATNRKFHAIMVRELMTGSKRAIKALQASNFGVFGLLQKKLEGLKAEQKLSSALNIRLAVVSLITPIFFSLISTGIVKNIFGFKEVDARYLSNLAEQLTRTFFQAWSTESS